MADDILDKVRKAPAYQAQCRAAVLKEEEHRRAVEELRNRLKQEKHNPDIYVRLASCMGSMESTS